MKEYKNFEFRSKEDFIFYLRDLVISVYKAIKSLDFYLSEIKEDIEKYDLHENEKKLIPSQLYESHRDKIENVKSRIVNLLGDHSTGAMSYKKFRYEVEKYQRGTSNLQTAEITEEMRVELNNLNVVRNWLHHIPESMLISQIEIIKLKYGEDYFKHLAPFNPVYITDFEFYEALWLLDLYNDSLEGKALYRKIHQQMKRDYTKLTGTTFSKESRKLKVRPFEDISLVQMSMSMQRKEFKGIDNAGEKKLLWWEE